MPRHILALATLIIFCPGLKAEIYKWTDKDGKTHYSNSKPATENTSALSIQEEYTPGAPVYHQRPTPRATTRPQNHYVHAPTPGASLSACEDTKISAVYAAKAKRRTQEKHLEEWLWKNCRAYSRELRKIEQQMM